MNSLFDRRGGTHVILHDDRPYEAQDDGRSSIDDVRNVYVD